MTSNITTAQVGDAEELLFDSWFDPIEDGLRAKVRGFIETMVETKLQPVYVDDVAEAVTRLIANNGATSQPIYELGGPQIFTYEELLRTIARHIGARTKFMPMPFALWHALGWISERVPGAPLTRNQIELMEQDTVASPELPGLPALAIEPTAIEPVVLKIVRPIVRA